MADLEELSRELDNITSEISVLDDDLKNSKLSRYTDLVTRTGKLKGHLDAITPHQYEKIIGRKPPPGLAITQRDSTTKKIPYSMVLDQLTGELGYHGTRGEENLRDDIVDAKEDKQRLEDLKRKRQHLVKVIDDIEEQATKPEIIKDLEYPAPQFPENIAKAEAVIVPGATYEMRRQHSYWQIYRDDKQVDKERYADEARKDILDRAKKKSAAEINRGKRLRRITGQKRRITPKVPKLK